MATGATIVLLGFLIAAMTSGAATGIGSWDAFLRFATASTVLWAAARASPLVALPATTTAILLGGPTVIVALAACGYLGMCLVVFAKKDNIAIRIATASTGVLAAFSVPDLWFFGAPSVVAVIVFLPILGGGYRSLAFEQRRRLRRIVALAAVAITAVSAAAGFTLWTARSDAASGIASARQAAESLAHADQHAAHEHAIAAERDLADADQAASRWWMSASRLVPILGQHTQIFQQPTGPALDAIRAAQGAIELIDAPRLRSATGGVNLDVVASLAEYVSVIDTSVEEVRDVLAAPSPWLVGPAASQLADARVDLEDIHEQVHTAATGLATVPALLGADGPVRYLIAMTTPAEARELGGIVANWVELKIDDGELVQAVHGRNTDLADRADPLVDETKYPERYVMYEPARWPQNLTGTPNFPTMANAVAEIWATDPTRTLDGVVYLDAFALVAMLSLTGPLEFEALDEPLTSDNALEFLLIGQYERFTNPAERIEFLGDVSRTAIQEITAGASPSLQQVVDVLGPQVAQGRLLFWSFDPNAQSVLSEFPISGRFPADLQDDFISIVHANAAATKLDTFLDRSVHYDITLNPSTNEIAGFAEVTLSNRATPALPGYVLGEPGTTNIEVMLSLYSPHQWSGTWVDGESMVPERRLEYGLERQVVFVTVTPDLPVVVTFEFDGEIDLGSSYSLNIDHQPVVNNDSVTVSVSLTSGNWTAGGDFDIDGAFATARFELSQDRRLVAEFTGSD